MEFMDIHSHILPGLDDGAKDLEETRDMLQIAYQEGVRRIIATPHFFSPQKSVPLEKIMETVAYIREKLKEWELPIELYPGNEIYYQSETVKLLEEGRICTMVGSRYVLVEFYPLVDFSYIREGLWRLLSLGYYPILAHAERYDCLFAKKERLEELTKQGIAIQVNASSFLGGRFQERTKRSGYLLKKGLVDFISTDAHSAGHRSPRIRECYNFICKKTGEEKAAKIFFQNPQAILQDKRLQ